MSTSETHAMTGLGADRVLEPPGSLPQAAIQVEAGGPVRPHEFEVAVERLCLDATSFANIRTSGGGDPTEMAKRVEEIVQERGKMHNPVTDSGGIAIGTVSAVGTGHSSAPPVGSRIATLASLTLTPLRLEAVEWSDSSSALVPVRGTAYVFESAPWAHLPTDLPLDEVIEIYDVYGAGSHTHDLAKRGDTVCVMGVGHAGKLALAAAKDTVGDGKVIAVDVDGDAVELVQRLGLCDIGVVTDLRNPVSTLEALRSAGAPKADLTTFVVSASRCEASAILATADHGSILFFSMATNFQSAALTADGLGSCAKLLIGSGYTPDVGAYSIDLLRRSSALRDALESKRP